GLLADEGEIAAVRERARDAAREFARVDVEQHRRQALRIGVDRESEQHQLDDRDADDHAEREPVALQLDELLADDAEPARERKKVGHGAGTAASSAGCAARLCIRWMNTSSRPGSIRCHVRPGSLLNGARAASSVAASVPVTCSSEPNAAT